MAWYNGDMQDAVTLLKDGHLLRLIRDWSRRLELEDMTVALDRSTRARLETLKAEARRRGLTM